MLTRTQIIKQFKITSPTFDVARGYMQAKPQAKHGNIFYDLTDRDITILESAKNHSTSFRTRKQGTAILLPFHRFLCLRFLTTPLDEILDEVMCRNLATERLDKSMLRRMQGRFFNQLPKKLQSTARKKDAPSSKLEDSYHAMLEVLGIEAFYKTPMYLEGFFELIGDPRVKQIVEVVFTTQGSDADHQEALAELSHYDWSKLAIDIYKSVFYDIYSMGDSDWKQYQLLLSPPERKHKARARELTTVELKIQEGLRPHFRETMELVMRNLGKKIGLAKDLGFNADDKTMGNLINMFTKAGSATGSELEAASPTASPFFETKKIISSKEDPRTIEDIKTIKVASVKNG